jgi:putative transcriptional regulator
MARPAKFSLDDLLDAASCVLLEEGRDITMAQIAHAAGAPTGSVYHRFASREELLIRLWLRSIKRFQVGFTRAGEQGEARSAVIEMALCVPQFCRKHPADAKATTLFRQEDLLSTTTGDLRKEVESLNEGIDAVTESLGVRRYGAMNERRRALLYVATRISPYGLLRPFIGADVPSWIDDAVAASAGAIAGLGDES